MADKEVAETTKEVVVKTALGAIVARMNLSDAALQGLCEWYDGRGDLVAYGSFEKGLPFTGTFLNWAKYFPDLNSEEPYAPAAYCQDWVTIFEAGFLSEFPKYEMVAETYSNGRKVERAM